MGGNEDWALLQLRFELHTLATSYKKDVNDEDRTEVPQEHFQFYYTRYYSKGFNFKDYGKENLADVCTLIPDTVKEDEGKLSIVAAEDADFSIYVKATEEARRARQRRIDAG